MRLGTNVLFISYFLFIYPEWFVYSVLKPIIKDLVAPKTDEVFCILDKILNAQFHADLNQKKSLLLYWCTTVYKNRLYVL